MEKYIFEYEDLSILGKFRTSWSIKILTQGTKSKKPKSSSSPGNNILYWDVEAGNPIGALENYELKCRKNVETIRTTQKTKPMASAPSVLNIWSFVLLEFNGRVLFGSYGEREFVSRDEPELIPFFGMVEASELVSDENNKRFLKFILHQSCDSFVWDLNLRNRACSREKYEIEYLDLSRFLPLSESSDHQESAARKETDVFLTEYSCTSSELSIEILMDEIIHVVTDKNEFDNQDKSKLTAFFGVFGLSQFWWIDFKTDVSIQTFLSSWTFSIETLMEKLKPVITDKNEFEKRHTSKLIALLGVSGITGVWCKDQKPWLFQWMVLYRSKSFHKDIYDRSHSCHF